MKEGELPTEVSKILTRNQSNIDDRHRTVGKSGVTLILSYWIAGNPSPLSWWIFTNQSKSYLSKKLLGKAMLHYTPQCLSLLPDRESFMGRTEACSSLGLPQCLMHAGGWTKEDFCWEEALRRCFLGRNVAWPQVKTQWDHQDTEGALQRTETEMGMPKGPGPIHLCSTHVNSSPPPFFWASKKGKFTSPKLSATLWKWISVLQSLLPWLSTLQFLIFLNL